MNPNVHSGWSNLCRRWVEHCTCTRTRLVWYTCLVDSFNHVLTGIWARCLLELDLRCFRVSCVLLSTVYFGYHFGLQYISHCNRFFFFWLFFCEFCTSHRLISIFLAFFLLCDWFWAQILRYWKWVWLSDVLNGDRLFNYYTPPGVQSSALTWVIVDGWHYSRVISFRFRSLVFLVWSYASEDCQDRAKFARFGH